MQQTPLEMTLPSPTNLKREKIKSQTNAALHTSPHPADCRTITVQIVNTICQHPDRRDTDCCRPDGHHIVTTTQSVDTSRHFAGRRSSQLKLSPDRLSPKKWSPFMLLSIISGCVCIESTKNIHLRAYQDTCFGTCIFGCQNLGTHEISSRHFFVGP